MLIGYAPGSARSPIFPFRAAGPVHGSPRGVSLSYGEWGIKYAVCGGLVGGYVRFEA